MSSRTDLLLLSDEAFFALKVVRALALAKRWRVHVLVQTHKEPCLALKWSRHIASFHATSAAAGDDRAYLAEIVRVVRLTGAKVIVPVVESATLFCIEHRAALNEIARLTPLPSAESFAVAIDKGRLAALMASHGIPHPATRRSDDPQVANLRFPVLIKPCRESGGKGIVRVDTLEKLKTEMLKAERLPARRSLGEGGRAERLKTEKLKSETLSEGGKTEINPAPGCISDSGFQVSSFSGSAFSETCVQEYVEGIDMGCSVLARNGRIEAWTVQRGLRRTSVYGAFDEVQIEACPAVLAVAKELVAALAWSGIAHIDFRIDARTGEPQVLEVNGRYWRTLLASVLATVNFPDLACRLALGEDLAPQHQEAGRFVQARLVVGDLLRLRPRAFRHHRSDLGMIVRDPLPWLFARGVALFSMFATPAKQTDAEMQRTGNATRASHPQIQLKAEI